jgi:hypothetical protein
MRFDKALSSALDTMIDHPSIRYAGKFAKPFGHLFKLSGFGQLPRRGTDLWYAQNA